MRLATSLAHTYSVVARDPRTGQLGVAVQSHWFSVGTAVSWAEPGVGAVATQSFVEMSYGPQGLGLLREGVSATAALRRLLARDKRRYWRQVAMVDSNGVVAAHTGERCVASAGHVIGDGWSVQGNMMVDGRVVPTMAETMARSRGDLGERLLRVLESAERAGGDIRGAQSAALLVVSATRSRRSWQGRILDLRIEDHHEPLKELRRLLEMRRAYRRMSLGIEAMLEGDSKRAVRESRASFELAQDNVELGFWNAVTLVRNGDLKGAIPQLRRAFKADRRWREYYPRLAAAGLLTATEVARSLDLLERKRDP
jgi:uncharacterized Ntn-hydrolase superfamily protein